MRAARQNPLVVYFHKSANTKCVNRLILDYTVTRRSSDIVVTTEAQAGKFIPSERRKRAKPA